MLEEDARRLSHRVLFTGFFQIGIFGFGGTLPVARRLIVDDRKWLSQVAFNELLSLCQFMPGANVCNFAFAFGARHRGWSGATVSVLGLLGAPVCIVMALGAAYARYGQLAGARHGLAGLAAAATGLVLGTALKIAAPVFTRQTNILVAVAVFALVFLLRLSLPMTMAIMLPVSLLLAWRSAG
jgi:chromate transporter